MITDTQFFPSFFLASPSLFLPRLPLAGDSKKVDIKSNSCSACWQQQFGDLHRAGRINKTHIYFLGSLSSFFLFRFVFSPVPQEAGGADKSFLWKIIPGSCCALLLWSAREGFAPSLGILFCPGNLQELVFYFWNRSLTASRGQQWHRLVLVGAAPNLAADFGAQQILGLNRFWGSAEPSLCRRKARPWAVRQLIGSLANSSFNILLTE